MSSDAPADPWKVDLSPKPGTEVDATMNRFSSDVQRAAAAALAQEALQPVPMIKPVAPSTVADDLARAVIPAKPATPVVNFDYPSRLNLEPKAFNEKPSREKFTDQAFDLITPGFGRLEFESGGAQWRLDYLYNRRCNTKGVGLCLSIKGW
jgi:hypothetical protein